MTISVPVLETLRSTFLRLNYTIDGVHELLGDDAFQALFRHEPVPAWLATTTPQERETSPLAPLVRLLLLGEPQSAEEISALFDVAEHDLADLLDSELFQMENNGLYRVALDARPVNTGFGNQWVFSDLDGALFPAATRKDHVLGVGEASLSLLRATPLDTVDSLLDIGTGCGIQALHGSHYAQRIIATDLSPRCCELAAATLAINGVHVAPEGGLLQEKTVPSGPRAEIRQGPWFDPVADHEFDAIVANPPFVVASEKITHSYRDSGLDLDGATELMVRQSPQYLKEGGHATILGAWVHEQGRDYRARLAQWVPSKGVDVWIVERDCVDPALYVATWMKDSGRDPADPQWRDYAAQWLGHLADHSVAGIGFGMVFMRKATGPSTLLIEELTAPEGDALAAESLSRWERWDNLQQWSTDELLSQRFALSPQAVFVDTATPSSNGLGTENSSHSVYRSDIPSFRHTIDEPLRAVLNGLSRDGLSAGDVAELLCTVQGWDWDIFRPAMCSALHALYLHGIITL